MERNVSDDSLHLLTQFATKKTDAFLPQQLMYSPTMRMFLESARDIPLLTEESNAKLATTIAEMNRVLQNPQTIGGEESKLLQEQQLVYLWALTLGNWDFIPKAYALLTSEHFYEDIENLEDLFQDSFTDLFEVAKSFEPDQGTFFSYAITSLLHKIRYHRAHLRYPELTTHAVRIYLALKRLQIHHSALNEKASLETITMLYCIEGEKKQSGEKKTISQEDIETFQASLREPSKKACFQTRYHLYVALVGLAEQRISLSQIEEILATEYDTSAPSLYQEVVPDHTDWGETEDSRKLLEDLMMRAELSDTEKACILLQYRDEFSYDEIADILHLARSKVGSLLERAKDKMGFAVKHLTKERRNRR
ncbi:MAG: sigma-70 family RNA polymerase sigma factor [Candidatus Woesebacteria bacterium]